MMPGCLRKRTAPEGEAGAEGQFGKGCVVHAARTLPKRGHACKPGLAVHFWFVRFYSLLMAEPLNACQERRCPKTQIDRLSSPAQ